MSGNICMSNRDSISGSELNFLVITLCCGMIGAIKCAYDGYKFSKGCNYFETVCKTVTYSIFGFYLGLVTVVFSPIVIPIGITVAVVRVFEKRIIQK